MNTAVITGASYGIGESIARILLENGWKVYGLSRTKPTFTDSLFEWLQCDLSDAGQIESALTKVSEPHIDLLVSNAGVHHFENASEVSVASYEQTFKVNVLAPMLLVAALKTKITNAVIISVSSVSDRFPEADMALYCSSKAANTLYFDSLAAELKDARVYTLLPDYVDTPMQHKMNDDNKEFDWSKTIKSEDISRFCYELICDDKKVESGSNIIIVTEKLKADLKSDEKLYGFNTDTNELMRI